MAYQAEGRDQGGGLLRKIHRGMKVVDREGEEVGTVKRIFLGTEDVFDETPAEDTIADAYEESSDLADDLDDMIREQFGPQGVIEVEGKGLLDPDRFAGVDQVQTVEADQVKLNVDKDELTKG